MPPSPASVSIIICAYTMERWQDICDAVGSAQQQEPAPTEIILVIDHNSALEKKARVNFPDVIVIRNEQERGLSGARNSGIAAAQGSVVAFLDDDAIADKKWTARLVEECEAPGVVGAVPWIQPLWEGQQPSWFPSEFLWVVGCAYKGLPKQRKEVRNLLGAACGFRRELFERVGGFSHGLGRTGSKLPISCEETEFCIRAKRVVSDAKFVFIPEVLIRHKVPAFRVTWSYFTLRCYAEGLSKAHLATLVGTERGLSSERSYVLRTLPAGIASGITDAILRLDASGIGRAAAIVWGLTCTLAGYAKGRLSKERLVLSEENTHLEPKLNAPN